MYQTWHLFDANRVRKNICPGELGSHMQLRTHISRRSYDSRQTLVISTVPLGVVTSKTLLALWETDVSNVAGFGFAYTAKRREGFLRLGHTLEYLAFFDVARNKRQAPRVPSDVRTFR